MTPPDPDDLARVLAESEPPSDVGRALAALQPCVDELARGVEEIAGLPWADEVAREDAALLARSATRLTDLLASAREEVRGAPSLLSVEAVTAYRHDLRGQAGALRGCLEMIQEDIEGGSQAPQGTPDTLRELVELTAHLLARIEFVRVAGDLA